MIKVIAIEPELMADPDFFREYFKDFGTSKGRWIPLIPHNWKTIVSNLVKRNRSLGPVKKNQIRDKIRGSGRYKERFVKLPEDLTFPDNWRDAVRPFCEDETFDAAIVSKDSEGRPYFLVPDEFDTEESPYSYTESSKEPLKSWLPPSCPCFAFPPSSTLSTNSVTAALRQATAGSSKKS